MEWRRAKTLEKTCHCTWGAESLEAGKWPRRLCDTTPVIVVCTSDSLFKRYRCLRHYFLYLKKKWSRETLHLSGRMEQHPAYVDIISLGKPVLPLIFESLSKEVLFWFVALEALTGCNPVKRSQWGHIESMRQTWLKWGREHGYLR